MNNQNGSVSKPHSITADSPATTTADPAVANHEATEPLLGGSDVNGAAITSTTTHHHHSHRHHLDPGSPLPANGAGACANAASRKAVTVVVVDNNENRRGENDDVEIPSQSPDTTGDDDLTSQQTSGAIGEPPDGGWGWVVVFSSFAISMLVDGVCFSFGIFFDEFRNEFQTSKAATSWIGSVLNGTYLLIGPIVSALVHLYGCRRVAMSGAVLASFAFFISTYSNTLGVLIFTYGFMGGFGFGLMYLPAIVMVGYYFQRRRALATGIACCGSGMGAFCFAPLSEFLLYEFGWRGATWILSGLVLNGVVFALFYWPLPEPSARYRNAKSVESSTTVTMSSEMPDEMVSLDPGRKLPSITVEEVDSGRGLMPGKPQPTTISRELKDQIFNFLQGGHKMNATHRTRSVMLDEIDHQEDDLCRIARSTDFGMWLRKRQDTATRRAEDNDGALLFSGTPVNVKRSLNPLERRDIFYSGSLMHLKEYQEVSTVEAGVVDRGQPGDWTCNHSTCDGVTEGDTTGFTSKTKSFSEALSSVFDFSLLKSPTFLVYGLSCFLCMAGFFVPFIYMPTHAIDMGLGSKKAAFLISIIGITNTFSRVGVGFVSDQPWADCLLINNIALIIGGTATVFVPYLPSYFLLATYAAVFGTSIAVFVSLRSIIMVELMGLKRLTTAFGFVIMCQGMSAFLGAPIAGTLSDMYGNYNAAFYLAGISLALGGVICIPLRRIAHWEGEWVKKKAAKQQQQLLRRVSMSQEEEAMHMQAEKQGGHARQASGTRSTSAYTSASTSTSRSRSYEASHTANRTGTGNESPTTGTTV